MKLSTVDFFIITDHLSPSPNIYLMDLAKFKLAVIGFP
jgi:hypothetical protein